MTSRIAVIGGGMAGLELANTLAVRGSVEVEVFERGPSVRHAHALWDRSVYPGDEKTRRWSGAGWGPEGGLSERLGGRSLCYHGVLIGIEQQALDAWPAEWSTRLRGPNGMYTAIRKELRDSFPELVGRPLTAQAESMGLRHVPQAVAIDTGSGRFSAYTPLTRTRELVRTRHLSITRAAVLSLTRTRADRWTLDVLSPGGAREKRGPYDACILTSSSIGNMQVLSQTLDRPLKTDLTDHLCVGALVRLAPGSPLRALRHHHLWSGFIPTPELRANIFVRELEPFPDGDRYVDFHAVVEQEIAEGAPASRLCVTPNRNGVPSTEIAPHVSGADQDLLQRVQTHIHQIADALSADTIIGQESPRLSRKGAIAAVYAAHAGAIAFYELPYGEYEHESSTHPMGGKGIPISPDLEIVEAPGIYVAGPGAFPRIGAANPALTIFAMSRSLASILATKY